MKTNLKLLYLLIFLISFFNVSLIRAQNENSISTSQYFEAPLIGRNYIAPPKGEGSPYLYDNWLKGYVIFLNGDTVSNKLFKLDCFKNEFVWMSDGKSLIALDHNMVKSFTLFPQVGLPERKFEKASLKLPLFADTLVRYLEVMASGKINLFAFRRVVADSESVLGKTGGLYQMSVYSNEPVYFIQADNKPVKLVKFQKKSIIEAYPELSSQLKKIFKEKHYGGIRNEYQLKQAIDIINTNWN